MWFYYVRIPKVGAADVGLVEISVANVSSVQLRTFEAGVIKKYSLELGPLKLSILQV